jgi:hypothetical protein
MRFSEHPTWRMLEEGKQYLSLLAGSVIDVEVSTTIVYAMNSLHALQIELEDQLITDLRDENE